MVRFLLLVRMCFTSEMIRLGIESRPPLWAAPGSVAGVHSNTNKPHQGVNAPGFDSTRLFANCITLFNWRKKNYSASQVIHWETHLSIRGGNRQSHHNTILSQKKSLVYSSYFKLQTFIPTKSTWSSTSFKYKKSPAIWSSVKESRLKAAKPLQKRRSSWYFRVWSMEMCEEWKLQRLPLSKIKLLRDPGAIHHFATNWNYRINVLKCARYFLHLHLVSLKEPSHTGWTNDMTKILLLIHTTAETQRPTKTRSCYTAGTIITQLRLLEWGLWVSVPLQKCVPWRKICCVCIPRKDQCDVCGSFKHMNISTAEYDAHEKNDEARQEKSRDKESANKEKSVWTMNLQAVLLCPKTQASCLYYKTGGPQTLPSSICIQRKGTATSGMSQRGMSFTHLQYCHF